MLTKPIWNACHIFYISKYVSLYEPIKKLKTFKYVWTFSWLRNDHGMRLSLVARVIVNKKILVILTILYDFSISNVDISNEQPW